MSDRTAMKKALATQELIAACKNEDAKQALAEAQIAIKNGADVDAVDDKNAPPIYNAVAQGNLALVELLIASHANVNKAIPLDPHKSFTASMEPWVPAGRVYDTALHLAAKCVNVEDQEQYDTYLKIGKALTEAGASLIVRDMQNCTPFEAADYYIGISAMSEMLANAQHTTGMALRRGSSSNRGL